MFSKKMLSLVLLLLLSISLLSGCSSGGSEKTVSYYDIYGSIKTQEFNSPIENAKVTISGKSVLTDAKGTYSIKKIESGNHLWEVTSDIYQDFSYEINIDGNTQINKQLSLNIGSAKISGNVAIYNDTGYTSQLSSNNLNESRPTNSLNKSEDERKYIENEIIVKYKGFLSAKSIQSVQNKQNLKKINSLDSRSGKMVKYNIPAGKTVEEMVKYYNNLSEVEFAEPNYIIYPLAVPEDTYYSYQWGTIDLNLQAAWDQKKNSDSVTVAVIDSGIVPNHPDLKDNLLQGADFVDGIITDDPSNYNVTDFDPTDESTTSSHGTHVAGIIGAVSNNDLGVAGVNWSTNILPIRIFDENGSTTVWDELEGIYYAIDRGVDVINLSLGSPNYLEAEHTAIKDAYNAGIVIVASAGNGGSDGIGDYGMLYPAGYEETIAVGALDRSKNVTEYSNYGPKLDLVAPGGSSRNMILSTSGYYDGSRTVPIYEYMLGTSMAAPYVSGIAALLIADGSSPNEVKNRLTSTAVDLGASGRDNYYGYGLVDAYGALLNKKLENPYVFAANIKNDNIYIKSEITKMNDDGSYNLNKVVPEEVYIVGWRDVNNNQEIDAGDYFGEYSSTIIASENYKNTASFDMYYVTKSSTTSMEVKGLPEIESK